MIPKMEKEHSQHCSVEKTSYIIQFKAERLLDFPAHGALGVEWGSLVFSSLTLAAQRVIAGYPSHEGGRHLAGELTTWL